MYIEIRGPQVHQSLTGEFDLYVRAERRNVLSQLNVHLRCVWYCFTVLQKWLIYIYINSKQFEGLHLKCCTHIQAIL